MGANRDPGGECLDAERRRFAATCQAVRDGLGRAPFTGSDGRLRVPPFYSVFVAFAAGGAAACPCDIAARFEALRADPEFALHAGAESASAAPRPRAGGRGNRMRRGAPVRL